MGIPLWHIIGCMSPQSCLRNQALSAARTSSACVFGATLGKTSQVKVDDIDQPHQGFMSLHKRTRETPKLAVVAVAWGEGFTNLFKDLGCHGVVSCGG